jgi:hypothetical protein
MLNKSDGEHYDENQNRQWHRKPQSRIAKSMPGRPETGSTDWGRAGAEDLVWGLPSVKDLRSGRPLDLVRIPLNEKTLSKSPL